VSVVDPLTMPIARRRQRGGRAVLENRQCAIPDGLAEAFDKLRSASGIDAVRQPGDLALAGGLEETRERGQGFNPFDRIGFWRQLAQRHARGAGRHQRDVARWL
jgi:hypothetical protein